jgi:Chitin binding Peritrophin-A domain.
VTFYSFWVSLTHNKLHLLFIFFIRCTKSGIKQISCPSGLAFDVDKQTCDWKGKVNNCDRLESKSYNSWWRWRSLRQEIKWETDKNLLLIHHSIIYLAIIFITRTLIRIFGTFSLDSGIYIRKELFVHGHCCRVKWFRVSSGFLFLNVELLHISVVQFRLLQGRNLKSLACLMPACYTDLRNLT